MLAPVCFFTYNRLDETKETINSLKNNFLSTESDLIIFSDGGKDENTWKSVYIVRDFLKTISGFRSVQIIEAPFNKGLAESIIQGVTQTIETFGKVIVVEDDLVLSNNFLDFMNQSLDYYENNKKILSISGFSFSNTANNKFDVNFGVRASSWGWATWSNRWNEIDWEVKTYKKFKSNIIKRIKFNIGGSDMSHMLDKQMSGTINSWAIRFTYHQFIHNLLDVYPVESKVSNIGFNNKATNSQSGKIRFRNKLDNSNNRNFNFPNTEKLNFPNTLKFYWRYSITMRLISKFIAIISNLKTYIIK